MMAAQQGKLRIEENNGNEKKPQKSDGISNQKSEPTSEEYDDDEELPELTLTENSESYDSNDSLNNVVATTKDLMDKGWKYFFLNGKFFEWGCVDSKSSSILLARLMGAMDEHFCFFRGYHKGII